jgi:hypothetical protein
VLRDLITAERMLRHWRPSRPDRPNWGVETNDPVEDAEEFAHTLGYHTLDELEQELSNE